MNTVNMNELLAAHICFNIQEQDVQFGEDGELIGYSEVGEGYFGDDRVEVEHEALTDTTTLSDDCVTVAETRIVDVETGMTLQELYEYSDEWVDASKIEWMREEDLVVGRWAHLKDAHCEEREAMRNTYLRLDVKGAMYGEMERRQAERQAKYLAMMAFVDTCFDMQKLRRMQDKMWKLFIGSTKFCVKTGDWWQIYMTKQDVRQVSDFITAKRKWFLYGQVVDEGLVEYFKEQQAEGAVVK
jgi:hypothetical protein